MASFPAPGHTAAPCRLITQPSSLSTIQPPGVRALGTGLIGHGRNEQVIRDIPTHGKRMASHEEMYILNVNP
ncbi:MAG: hypothetical protein B7Y07_03085 [Halothiobacillus sp. 24-54-40]|jgi:hypothetical protein|nr:MAG: hypothetical protein B7Y58_02570 [Halothiobacillus sp. 35-54-62]OYZ87679.1 MAG: hypothetical protein B7Y07_03085 [Halothiobacillus sp. 24-54-40]OZA81172.1 MAG: hypothetical protein B7X64_02810 [Halothiobacillus sp. 39-53-45]